MDCPDGPRIHKWGAHWQEAQVSTQAPVAVNMGLALADLNTYQSTRP